MSKSNDKHQREALRRLKEISTANSELQRAIRELRALGEPRNETLEETLRLSRSLESLTREAVSGETEALSEIMGQAIAAALASQTPKNWSAAMEAIANWAIRTRRPAAFAGAVLDSLSFVPVPVEACAKLVGPLAFERDAKAPGYEWDWEAEDEEELSAKAAWEAAEARCARAFGG